MANFSYCHIMFFQLLLVSCFNHSQQGRVLLTQFFQFCSLLEPIQVGGGLLMFPDGAQGSSSCLVISWKSRHVID